MGEVIEHVKILKIYLKQNECWPKTVNISFNIANCAQVDHYFILNVLIKFNVSLENVN